MRWVVPGSLFAVNLIAYGLLVTVGQKLSPPLVTESSRLKSVSVGEMAPNVVLDAAGPLPATIMVFPSCNECTLEDPSMLRGQKFDRKVVVLLPGASSDDVKKYKNINPSVSVTSGSKAIAELLGISSVPRVYKIDTDGRFSFVQPRYVTINAIHEVVNGS